MRERAFPCFWRKKTREEAEALYTEEPLLFSSPWLYGGQLHQCELILSAARTAEKAGIEITLSTEDVETIELESWL